MSEIPTPSQKPFEQAAQTDIPIPVFSDLTTEERQLLPKVVEWVDEAHQAELPSFDDVHNMGSGMFRQQGEEKQGINNFWFFFNKDPDNLYAKIRHEEYPVWSRLQALINHDDETIRPEFKPVREAVNYLEDIFTNKQRREQIFKERPLSPITTDAFHITYNVMRRLVRKDDPYVEGSATFLIG